MRVVEEIEGIQSGENVRARLAWLGERILWGGFCVMVLFLPTSESAKNIGYGLALLGGLIHGAASGGFSLAAWRRAPLLPFLLAWLAAASLSTWYAIQPPQSLRGLWDVLRYSSAYLLAAASLSDENRRLWFARMMAVGIGAGLLWAGWALAHGQGHGGFEEMRLQVRSLGFPNQTATSLIIYAAFLFGILRFCPPARPADRVLFGTVFGLSVIGLVLTGSRGGWVAAATASLAIAVATSKRPLAAAGGVVLSLALVVGVLSVVAPERAERIMSIASPQKVVQMQERFDTWRAGLKILNDAPIFGIGLKNMAFVNYERYAFEGRPDHAHNHFLNVLIETGEAGFAVFMVLLGAIAWRLVRLRSSTGAARTYWTAAAGAFLAIIVQGLVNISFHVEPALLLMTMLGGLEGARTGEGRV
ncbi:MAG: O-antigen ligase family protein [Nitrospirae bacterium]|nr:O-antigen ligase family protein [Nitrospirota bacterium]